MNRSLVFVVVLFGFWILLLEAAVEELIDRTKPLPLVISSFGDNQTDDINDQSATSVVESTIKQYANGTGGTNDQVGNFLLSSLLKNPNAQSHLEHFQRKNPSLMNYLSQSHRDGHALNDVMQKFLSSRNNTKQETSDQKPPSNEETKTNLEKNDNDNDGGTTEEHDHHGSDDEHSNRFYKTNRQTDSMLADWLARESLSENVYVTEPGSPYGVLSDEAFELHTHSSEQKEIKDTHDSKNPLSKTEIISTSLNNKNQPSLSQLANNHHKSEHHASTSYKRKQGDLYVPVNEGMNFNEQLNCCEQLFNKYGKNSAYEEPAIYLVPPPRIGGTHRMPYPPYGLPSSMFHARPPSISGYLGGKLGFPIGAKGYIPMPPHPPPYAFESKVPVISVNVKDLPNTHSDEILKPRNPTSPPVDCIEEIHHYHSGHPPAAHYGSYHHQPHYSPFRLPPPSVILTKKLALLGKKYLLG